MKDDIKYFFPRLKSRFDEVEYIVKRKWQRFFRGYADSDLWSMDGFLAEFLHKMMDRFIKSKRHGYPAEFAHPDWYSGKGETSEEEDEEGSQKWEAVLIKMRDGFQAAKDLCSDAYFEIEDYPMRRDSKGKILPMEWEPVEGDERLSRMKDVDDPEHEEKLKIWNKHYEAWREERNKTFEEGMDLLKKYFFALWD